jgi:hypothetical protein
MRVGSTCSLYRVGHCRFLRQIVGKCEPSNFGINLEDATRQETSESTVTFYFAQIHSQPQSHFKLRASISLDYEVDPQLIVVRKFVHMALEVVIALQF